jgi:hypothetical protein
MTSDPPQPASGEADPEAQTTPAGVVRDVEARAAETGASTGPPPPTEQPGKGETDGAPTRALDGLLGNWEFTMHHSQMSDPVTGRQRYERVLDGAFVLLHWAYDHPDFPDALALLSADRYYYFDVRGLCRIFDLEADDAGWSMIRLDEHFSQRTTARFRGADRMESNGEVSRDRGVTWQPDFTMSFRRA